MRTIQLGGSGHCCICARVCWHVNGPFYCADHKPQPRPIGPIVVYPQPGSWQRPSDREDRDRAHVGDSPCPARCTAVLGFATPTQIPCGLVAGHAGSHRYSIEWREAGES